MGHADKLVLALDYLVCELITVAVEFTAKLLASLLPQGTGRFCSLH